MNAQDDHIFQNVKAIMGQMFRIPSGFSVSTETTSADVEGWDSLSHAVLIMKIEESLGVNLPLDRAYAVKNVGELVQLLREAKPSI